MHFPTINLCLLLVRGQTTPLRIRLMSTLSASNIFNRQDVSSVYAKYRPVYTDQLRKLVIDFCGKNKSCDWHLALDVGCGPGQSTLFLGENFKQVIGVDSSKEQIRHAPQHLPNVSFRCGSAHDLHFITSSTVDLVTVGTAFHWFDKYNFFKEADRVLKPGGCLVLYSIGVHFVSPQVANDYLDTLDIPGEIVRLHPPTEMIINKYQDVTLPYPGWVKGELDSLKVQMNIDEFSGYIASLGPDQWFSGSPKGHDLPGEIARTLTFLCRKKLESELNFRLSVSWPIVYVMGHKPS